MSEPAEEVTEAIVETDAPEVPLDGPAEPSRDEIVERGVESIAQDLFGVEPKDEEPAEEVSESPEEPAEETAESPEEPEAEVEPAREAPQSWKKEMHDSWAKLDPEVQEYIELREDQMKNGLEKDRHDAELGRSMRDVFAPYERMLQAKGITHEQTVSQLMNTHYRLATGTPEQKRMIMDRLSKSYGIEPTPADGEAQPIDPQIQALQNQVNQLTNQLNAGQRASLQEARDKIGKEVEAFASEHPYFDDLSEEIALQIKAGHDLEDAYKIAYRASNFYDKDLEKTRKEEEKKAQQERKAEAEKAKKAKSVNVKGRDTSKAPTAPKGTMEDTLRETFRKIQSRN